MKIATNYRQPSNQIHFGDVTCTKKALAFLNRTLSKEEAAKANEIIAGQVGKKPNIHLHLGSFQKITNGEMMPYLRAQVGDMLFQEGLFTSTMGVIKKAAKYVDSLAEKAAK